MNKDDYYQPFDFLSANGISADHYNSGYNAQHGFIGLGPKSTFWADLMEGAIGGGFTVGLSVNMRSTSGTILMGARESSYTGTNYMSLQSSGESYSIPNMTLGTVYLDSSGSPTSEYFQ